MNRFLAFHVTILFLTIDCNDAFCTPKLFRSPGYNGKALPRIVATELKANDSNRMADSYRKVAAEDPEWFDKYVVQTLGEENISSEILRLCKQATIDNKAKQVEETEKKFSGVVSVREEQAVMRAESENEKGTCTTGNMTNVKVKHAESGTPFPNTDSREPSDLQHDTPISVIDHRSKVPSVTKRKEFIESSTKIIKPVGAKNEEPSFKNKADYVHQTLLTMQNGLDSNEKQEEVIDKGTTTMTSNITSTKAVNVSTASRAEMRENDDRVDDKLIIMYKDPFSDSWAKVPLATLAKLGYSQSDVKTLRADVLDLILEESLGRPRSGIPGRWKVKPGEASNVRIIFESDAKEQHTINTTHRPRTRNAKISIDYDAPGIGDVMDPRDARRPPLQRADPLFTEIASNVDPQSKEDTKESKSTPNRRSSVLSNELFSDLSMDQPSSIFSEKSNEDKLSEQSNVDKKRDKEERRHSTQEKASSTSRRPHPRERSNFQRNGERKPIYNGRSTSKTLEKSDPPPPRSFWPDMETFRSLLRNEAGFRLRILGDDWADVVKDESNWRHDLYKEWLWTLHNGIGKPIVESRTDRLRRRQYQEIYADSSVPRQSPRKSEQAAEVQVPSKRQKRRTQNGG